VRSVLSLVSLALVLAAAGCSREETPAVGESHAVTEDAARALSPVRFHREYVKVEASRRLTRVSALYYFRNESDRRVEQGISYPFPVDRFHLYPRVVRVWEKTGDDLRAMGFLHRERNVLWTMDLEPGEEIVIRVDYTQEIRRPRAVYIVTTTKEWERPIEVAEFEFRVPAELDSVELSFEPDSRTVEGDTIVYYVGYTDFMPDEDMVVTWKE
jgi:hypothetical protein